MREEKIRTFLRGAMIVASISAVLLTLFAFGFFEESGNAWSWPGDGDWILMKDDGDDGCDHEVDIRDFSYYVTDTHVFFNIETEADYQPSKCTIGVVLDDTSLTAYDNELAISSYRDGSTNKAKCYYWDGDNWETEKDAVANHIRVNDGSFHGVDLAIKKSEMDDHCTDFSTDLSDVRVKVYTTDGNTNAFEYVEWEAKAHWKDQNTPSAWADDATDSIEIPLP